MLNQVQHDEGDGGMSGTLSPFLQLMVRALFTSMKVFRPVADLSGPRVNPLFAPAGAGLLASLNFLNLFCSKARGTVR
ncbi:MAG: hypothetical protein QOG13_2274 [Sphingomonadales bacterium]|jgi:hypothetical protein|nr:hypothetical protein [Sphingomonadales bacterium]MEA3043073.1 hypothetical protein [Sphingomonadales bacterium]